MTTRDHNPARIRRPRRALLAALAVASVLAGAAAVSQAGDGPPSSDPTWFDGAMGFTRGFERAEAENQPVLIYFYADWCGYCRQLESKLLYRDTVENYTKYLVKIRINPEKGPHERELARQYGVRGYPTVFVHPAPTDRPKLVSRSVIASGERRLMTPDEYVKALSMAVGSTFGTS